VSRMPPPPPPPASPPIMRACRLELGLLDGSARGGFEHSCRRAAVMQGTAGDEEEPIVRVVVHMQFT